MSDPYWGLAAYGAIFVGVLAVAGLYADHMRRKYQALADAEREAADHPGS